MKRYDALSALQQERALSWHLANILHQLIDGMMALDNEHIQHAIDRAIERAYFEGRPAMAFAYILQDPARVVVVRELARIAAKDSWYAENGEIVLHEHNQVWSEQI